MPGSGRLSGTPTTFCALFPEDFFLPACSLLRQVWSSPDLAGRWLRRREML